MNVLDSIAQFVYPPSSAEQEDPEKRQGRVILVVMAAATTLGGLIWGTVYVWLGVPEVSIWPYGYVVLSAINLVVYLRNKSYKVLLYGQLALILLVPTFLMWHIGGFAASGGVILWSFLAPIVALVVSENHREARWWFAVFVGLVLFSGVIESRIALNDVGMPGYGKNAFFVMNFLAPMTTTYYIVFYFIGAGRTARAALLAQSDELEAANQSLTALTESLEEKVRQRTHELRNALGNLSAVINSLVDGLVVTDVDGKITNYNPMATQMFGVNVANVSNQSFATIFKPDMVEVVQQVLKNPTQSAVGEVALAGNRIGNAATSAIVVQPNSYLADDDTAVGNHIGTVTLIRDITREKEVDEMKTNFISTVSHELRTPLTSILGFAKIIQKRLGEVVLPELADIEDKKVNRATKQITSNVDIIVSEGERLTVLINDVLDIAKMEAGRVEWDMRDLKMSEVVDRAAKATSGLFTETPEVTFNQAIDADLPNIKGDKDRLIQVLVNLISNASKFTEQGSVTCRVQAHEDAVLVSVQDTGMGIEADGLTKIFEKFTQVGNTLTDKPQGTGLGLPICKQIVEAHGGRIWAESTLGQGATINFTIPTSAASASTNGAMQGMDVLVEQLRKKIGSTPTPTNGNAKRILVVDDEGAIRQLLRQLLEAEGYTVLEAVDGVEAIKQIKQHSPDLIILDVMMPNVNGFDVAAVLKGDPDTMRIPIIILSIVEDQERGYRLGVDRYLNKPIDTEKLMHEIEEVLERGASPRRVLVMDEDSSVVKNISDVLAAKGYQVVEASSNDELLSKAVQERPDMIVLTSVSDEQNQIVQTLRFERGLDNIYIVLYQ
ncbi:MAG: response regulator [Chloroflexota bacterium]